MPTQRKTQPNGVMTRVISTKMETGLFKFLSATQVEARRQQRLEHNRRHNSESQDAEEPENALLTA